MSVATHVAVALIVRHYQDDVGRIRGYGTRRKHARKGECCEYRDDLPDKKNSASSSNLPYRLFHKTRCVIEDATDAEPQRFQLYEAASRSVMSRVDWFVGSSTPLPAEISEAHLSHLPQNTATHS